MHDPSVTRSRHVGQPRNSHHGTPYDIGSLLAQARMTSDVEWLESSAVELRTDVREIRTELEIRGDLRLGATRTDLDNLTKKVDKVFFR